MHRASEGDKTWGKEPLFESQMSGQVRVDKSMPVIHVSDIDGQ